jgi:hypothetical protein
VWQARDHIRESRARELAAQVPQAVCRRVPEVLRARGQRQALQHQHHRRRQSPPSQLINLCIGSSVRPSSESLNLFACPAARAAYRLEGQGQPAAGGRGRDRAAGQGEPDQRGGQLRARALPGRAPHRRCGVRVGRPGGVAGAGVHTARAQGGHPRQRGLLPVSIASAVAATFLFICLELIQ